MIVCRILQGMGGGSLVPLAQAILRETFPKKEQGMAMAIFSMGVVLAPAIGPVLGGWLTDNYGWAWIFYINIPVSLVGMLMVGAFVHDPPYLRRGSKEDRYCRHPFVDGGFDRIAGVFWKEGNRKIGLIHPGSCGQRSLRS